MKKYLLIIFTSLIMFLIPAPKKDNKIEKVVSTVSVYSSSYVVMERSSYKILAGNNIHKSQSVASISKIMTAIVAIENNNLNDVVNIPKEINTVYGSMLYLKENDKVHIMDLLYGLILRSGNDAAISIAIHTGTTVARFVELMNNKARELNLTDTLFRNPHGLDEEDGGNISSARDMAIIHSYALNNPIYRQISSSKQYKTYKNKNKILANYEYATGGKTGFTKKAKRTLVTSAKKDDLELVIVTLNCGNDFEVHKNLYEYYFSLYKGLIVLKKGINYIDSHEINLNKEYVFIIENSDKEYYLKYEILNKSKELKIYLLDKNQYVIDILTIDI